MSVAKRTWRGLLVVPVLACSALVACGDDDPKSVTELDAGGDAGPRNDGGPDSGTPADTGIGADTGVRVDSGLGNDAGLRDAASDASVTGDGAVKPGFVTELSATGHDRFRGVTYDAQGNIFAVGHSAEATANTSDSQIVVAKFNAQGALVESFGTAGIARKNVVVGGQDIEGGYGIVVLADGKIVVAGEADHNVVAAGSDAGVLARDTDLVLVRFLATGLVDETFGSQGVVRHDIRDGVQTIPSLQDGGVGAPTLSGRDTFGSLSLAGDKLVIHAAARAAGTTVDGGLRTDSDFTLLRLNLDGSLDTSFATTAEKPGILQTDVGQVNASARSATVLANGDIVGAGYATTPAVGQNPVLYKVKADGTRDATFAVDQTTLPGTPAGVWYNRARTDMKNAEAYGAALQGDKFVTLGYGPTPATDGLGTDWVFFRFNANGTQDKTFGTNGETFVDPAKFADNGRGLLILPDNRVLGIGRGRPTPAVPPAAGQQPANIDGMISILTPMGQPDATFAPGGFKLYDFGITDEFHACAVAPNKLQAAVVGVAGGPETGTDDNAVLVLVPLPAPAP
jgi:uncharacterized delta-60 repeat protein